MSPIYWHFGPLQFTKSGSLWTLSVSGFGLCGIGLRMGLYRG
ncbi:MAG: hypothetical protein E7K86_12735 [Pseudomonas aeruginosa]|nr:hypothetical protein [Pseudomonas aeruginosa]MCU9035183.1 hypothetical protein [Pseudomonas aeruginosa]MCV4361557.1 hypothetical protein [Pseudomonas aeruginosa]MCX2517355.1 hypothetical protein [Pseudomonas aeruginosa]MDI2177197.1 hypothetical protein [Pseudomonas aeruginosa]MDU7421452.1 hypothetical protein [Pseudomonas aeruginosa]